MNQIYVDDAPQHELLTPHEEAPLIETSVSKVMDAKRDDVYAHFFGSQPELRLDLHRDHVKGYNIIKETADTLEYEFVFEAYGTRQWGRAVEVASRPDRIDVEVIEGPLAGQSIVTLFAEVDGGTKVTQINRVWPGSNDMVVKLMGNRLKSRLAALAGVHLEQHRCDLEGEEAFRDRFTLEKEEKMANAGGNSFTDFLKTTRAIALPTVILPLLAAGALASAQDTFSGLALALTILGGSCALLAANLINDLYDFKHGADQAARQIPGSVETGSGAFVEGRWSLRKGWVVTLLLLLTALGAGVALGAMSDWIVLAYAGAGALISFLYVGPPFPLAYKGRGLGEVTIFTAFGLLPVLGGILAHGGTITPQAWWLACIFGFTSTLVLYHHHFLHWQADKAAGKGSPVALMGPKWGSVVGLLLMLCTSATVAGAVYYEHLPVWSLIACITPLLLVAAHGRILKGDDEVPARMKVAGAAFGAMSLTGIAVILTLWLV